MAETSVKKIGGYELVGKKPLGTGSFGEVWKAKSPTTGKLVALKITKIQPPSTADPATRFKDFDSYLGNFYHEAQVQGMLKHENIAAHYDVGFEGNRAYIASELIEGKNLSELLAKVPANKSLKEDRVIDVSRQIAQALDYIHGKKLVHRDLKPANVVLTKDGRVVVLDLGIAKPEMLKYNPFAGSPNYTSPEQAKVMLYGLGLSLRPKNEEERAKKQELTSLYGNAMNTNIDARSDLFSLGIMMYEMLTGRHPFTRKVVDERGKAVYRKWQTPEEAYNAIAYASPKTPYELTKGKVSKELSEVIMKLLEKNRDKRYKNAGKLLKDLNELAPKPGEPTQPKVEISKEIEDFVEKALSREEVQEHVPKKWWELWISSRPETKKRVLSSYLNFLDTLSPDEWSAFTSPSAEFPKERKKLLEKAKLEGGGKTRESEKRLDRLFYLRKLFEESLPEKSISGLKKAERADVFWNSMHEYARMMIQAREKGAPPDFKPQDVFDSWSESGSQALDWLALCEYRGYKMLEDKNGKGLKAVEPAYHVVHSSDEKEADPSERERSKKIFEDVNFKLLNKFPWLLRLKESELNEVIEDKATQFTEESVAARNVLRLRGVLKEYPEYIATTTPIKEGFDEINQDPFSGEFHGKVRVVDLSKSAGTTNFQKTLSGLTSKGFLNTAIKVRKVSELKDAEGNPLPDKQQADVFKSYKSLHSQAKGWAAVFEPAKFYSVNPGDLLQKLYVKKEQAGVGFYVGVPHYSLLEPSAQRLHEEALRKLSEKTSGNLHGSVLEKIPKPGPGFIVSALIASILADKAYSARKRNNPDWSFTKLMNG